MVSLATVYIDESGTHVGSPVVTVAGLVSNADEWAVFSKKWQQTLEESNIEYFHMTDFENCHGEFSGWSRDARKALLNKLLSIIQEHIFWSVSSSIIVSSYDSLLCEAAKQLCGGAYGAAALNCWLNLGTKLKKIDAWMNCTMEAGAKGFGALKLVFDEDSKFPEWSNEHRILNLNKEEKVTSSPLQAADILAYENWKEMTRIIKKETRNMRYPYKLLAKKPHTWVYLEDKHLQQFNNDVIKQLNEFNTRHE